MGIGKTLPQSPVPSPQSPVPSPPDMEQLKPRYSVVWINKIAEVPQDAWDALAMPLKTPFLEWRVAEQSGNFSQCYG